MKSESSIRQEIVEAGRRLYAAGLVAATDGNISARLPGDHLVVTPAGSCLGDLRAEQLIVVALHTAGQRCGGLLPARRQPTSELSMHLCAYAERPEIGAVVHAHPPTVTAFTVAGRSLDQPVLPEIVLSFGAIPTAPYATPSTAEGAAVIRGLIRGHDVVVLDRHGAVAVGQDPLDAFRRIEKLEHAARVLFLAHQLGRIQTLPADEVAALTAMSRRGSPLPLPDRSRG